ncbi:hypothetical protein MLD38_035550 [Melastoma candidum]|uniref:Uncharacterized protein n=1 Tax=Melastoma candidum TaxID=119954 RepID=A0ACB9LH56_9MYRT|nr:hypothetical protein MLD38_035550 [Melastoma candidum]
MKEGAGRFVVKPSLTEKFEVSLPLADSDRFIVDLRAGSCSCRSWQLHGIPCTHALCCILYMHRRVEDYVDPCFKMEAYRQAYMHVMEPLEGCKFWPEVDGEPIRPPPYKKLPGRPRKQNRKKSNDEDPKTSQSHLNRKGLQMTCKLCGNIGHNRRTCRRQPSSQPSSSAPSSQPTELAAEPAEAANAETCTTRPYGSGVHWRVKCKLCGQVGHNKRTCLKRKAEGGSGGSAGSGPTTSAEIGHTIPDLGPCRHGRDRPHAYTGGHRGLRRSRTPLTATAKTHEACCRPFNSDMEAMEIDPGSTLQRKQSAYLSMDEGFEIGKDTVYRGQQYSQIYFTRLHMMRTLLYSLAPLWKPNVHMQQNSRKNPI